ARDVADWCTVHIVEPDGSISEAALAHRDPTQITFAREIQERYPPDTTAPTGAPAVIRTGEPELVPEITEEMVVAGARDELHRDLLLQLGLQSYMCVPLKGRDSVVGAITFVSADPGRRYGRDELLFAEELAQRAAAAVENAQLYREAEARAQAARVLAAIGDGVLLVDRSGRVRLWNTAAERITGLPAGEVVGRRLADAVAGWRDVEPRLPVARPGEAGRAESVPFEDGTVYAFRDLTEERALESMRQDFVATVSHELRTPLAAIYGAALTLQRDDVRLEESQRTGLLHVISSEADRLARIVNDILWASRLDSGQMAIAIERCDAAALARLVVDAVRAHAPTSIALSLEAEDVPPVAADPDKLRQVLTNLVDNAVKYSPDGGRVRVVVRHVGNRIRFRVEDEGLGIPPSEQARIFEKFFRLDPNLTRGVGGTGLGLYICRELVHRMHGRIWVVSDGRRGSTFTVELP